MLDQTHLVPEPPVAAGHVARVRPLPVALEHVSGQRLGRGERAAAAGPRARVPGHVPPDVPADVALDQEPLAAVVALERLRVPVGHVPAVARPREPVPAHRTRRHVAREPLVHQRVAPQVVAAEEPAAARLAAVAPRDARLLRGHGGPVPAQAPGRVEPPVAVVAGQRPVQPRPLLVRLGHVPLQVLPPMVAAVALAAPEPLDALVPLHVDAQTVRAAERGAAAVVRTRVFRHGARRRRRRSRWLAASSASASSLVTGHGVIAAELVK